MSPHNTSQHLTTPHNTSQHLTIPHNTSRYLMLPHVTSRYLTLPHVTSRYLTLPHVTSRYLTLPHVTSRYLTLPHVTSRYLTLPHVTSRYLTLPHVTSRYLVLCHLMLPITRKDMRYFLKSQMDEKNYKKRVEFKKAIDHTKVKTLCQESHYFGMSLLGCFYQFPPSFFFVFLTNLTFFIVPVRYNNVSNSLLLSGTCKEAVTFLNIHSR